MAKFHWVMFGLNNCTCRSQNFPGFTYQRQEQVKEKPAPPRIFLDLLFKNRNKFKTLIEL